MSTSQSGIVINAVSQMTIQDDSGETDTRPKPHKVGTILSDDTLSLLNTTVPAPNKPHKPGKGIKRPRLDEAGTSSPKQEDIRD